MQIIPLVIGYLFALIGWIASFYLWSQWLVYPKLRRRFRVCKPYPAVGWAMWLIGGSVLGPIGKLQHSDILRYIGTLIAIAGIGLIVFGCVRLLRANAAERNAARMLSSPPPEGTWPPPPNIPAA